MVEQKYLNVLLSLSLTNQGQSFEHFHDILGAEDQNLPRVIFGFLQVCHVHVFIKTAVEICSELSFLVFGTTHLQGRDVHGIDVWLSSDISLFGTGTCSGCTDRDFFKPLRVVTMAIKHLETIWVGPIL